MEQYDVTIFRSVSAREILDIVPGEKENYKQVSKEDECTLIFTSGTTGKQKGIDDHEDKIYCNWNWRTVSSNFPQEVVQHNNFFGANYHNALLPDYRGMNVESHTIFSLDEETGVIITEEDRTPYVSLQNDTIRFKVEKEGNSYILKNLVLVESGV